MQSYMEQKNQLSAKAPRRESQVNIELANLAAVVETANKEVEELFTHFASVLNLADAPGKPEAEAEKYVVPLAADIRNIRYRVAKIIESVQMLKSVSEL